MKTADIHRPPPDLAPDDGGGDIGWVKLCTARDDIEAHLLLGRLDLAAIETQALKDHSAGAWFCGGWNPKAPVAILVRRFQLLDARVVLAEIAFEGPAAETTRADGARDWRFPVAWWAIALVLGLAFTALGLASAAEQLDRCRGRECSTGTP